MRSDAQENIYIISILAGLAEKALLALTAHH